ncbi:MAG: NUDIX hydrolase [Deltaproteobacteria bacterium]|nr:NUDIX hydrolase [Deltaproteobacteria bacterium]
MNHENEHAHSHGHVEYRFCPRCGGRLEKRRVKAIEPERLVCAQCSFIFYLDPKVVAGTIFTVEGRVVLLRRGVEPALGKWVFPGGYVDRGESVREAAIRETQEESNVQVRLCSLLDVYSYPQSPNIIVVYAAEVVGGELLAGDESVEAEAFSVSRIPWRELAFQSTKEALNDYLRLYVNSKT